MIGVEDDTPTVLQSQSEISIEEWQSRRHRLSLLPGIFATAVSVLFLAHS
jgi:hypothetical protein